MPWKNESAPAHRLKQVKLVARELKNKKLEEAAAQKKHRRDEKKNYHFPHGFLSILSWWLNARYMMSSEDEALAWRVLSYAKVIELGKTQKGESIDWWKFLLHYERLQKRLKRWNKNSMISFATETRESRSDPLRSSPELPADPSSELGDESLIDELVQALLTAFEMGEGETLRVVVPRSLKKR
ncbi:MAG TPA: hypothetical protein VD999_00835 [Vitreimonas sp.]|nr:hypothetical protein [Vitreimonas sp.]